VSSFKGGTLIAEDVRDLDAHLRRICDPDGYRPDRCPRRGHGVLHLHCYPERHPRGEPGMPPVVRVAQYICAADECSATWRILPMFLARHLWRVWKTVERVALPDAVPSAAPPVPDRTQCRWRARLAAAARVLVVLLAASGGFVLESVAAQAWRGPRTRGPGRGREADACVESPCARTGRSLDRPTLMVRRDAVERPRP